MNKKFLEALQEIANTDKERSVILGIPIRSLTRYKAGNFPPPIPNFRKFPRLLHALAEDAEAEQEAAKCST
jgi:hypothetical protein